VVHALEICKQTGKTFTSFRTNIKKERPFNIVKIGLNRPREEMYERINNRVIEMMKEGMLNEAKEVYKYKGLNSLNTVGYKELFAFFDGTIPYEEAVRQIQSNTRRYMRKQLTWFKRDAEITWFNPEEAEKILEFVDTIVSSNMPQE
jgi:tRNA dimethylallyltransferase